MLPDDAARMAKSALWSTIAAGNVYFWHEVSTDYFAPLSAEMPFLHLRSLGVEEQFYIIWPAAMWTVWRLLGHRARPFAGFMALVIVVVSTAFAQWLLAINETRFAYYMLPSRAGELALGSALALARVPFVARPRTVWMIAAVAVASAGRCWLSASSR